MLLHSIMAGAKYPAVSKIMDITLDKYITLAPNDCGYGGTAEELILNYVHSLFLKDKSAASL